MAKRFAQATPGFGAGKCLDLRKRSLHHHLAAVRARARAEVDNMIRAAHRFFIVLDDDERISFLAQGGQRFEQSQIVARMQTDRGLIEHVEDAAQIRTKLRREPNALRLTAAQGLRRTAEREIAQPDVFHELETLLNLRHEIGGNRFLISTEAQLADQSASLAGGERGEVIDRVTLQPHVARNGVQARAMAGRTINRFILVYPFKFALGRDFIFEDRIARVFSAGLYCAIPDLAKPTALLTRAVR